MDITIDQQVALDEALIPHASRLRIGKITADVPEIYMQEFWVTATVHHHSIHFKMNNKKHTVNLEYIREIIQICPRIPNSQFDELPFEEAIRSFLKELGHSGEIKMITDVNINKLHQPWRSFAAVINKCLSGKSTSYDSLRLSQAQILWGMYHKKNVDFAYLLWEDFVYQVEHMDAKKSNEMYYPRFTKYGAILPIKLTNEAIRNSESYKEYYAIASGAEPTKTKASVRKKKSSSHTTITMPPLTTKGKRLKTLAKVDKPAKEKQPAMTSKAKGADKGTRIIPGVLDVPTYELDDNDDDSDGMNVEGDEMDDEGANKEDDADELYRDVNINLKGRNIQIQTTQVIEDTLVTLTLVNPEDVSVMTTAEPPLLSATTLPLPSIPIIPHVQQTPVLSPANVPSSFLQDLPNFGSLSEFDHRLKSFKVNFSEFMQINQFAEAISLILGIVDKYLNHRMNEAVKVAVQLQSDRLQDEAQTVNEDFLNKLDENIQKIIKEQVKVQVFKILPKIEKTVNEQLEAEVLTRLSNSSKTSLARATDLSELELKKILTDKMESNKDTITLKRRRDDEDKDEEPSTGSNRGSKRRRAGKESESTSAPKEKTSKTTGKSTEGSKSHHKSASEPAPAEDLMHTTKDLEEPAHQEFDTCATDDQPIEEAS
uniref:Monodehydroascorbate reductase n=1 Tax=Tanacetum cinerariifolium TaxID=118510 RepID=A0A6L2LH56_TANCI|nr:hypothetical protein [Tanacetum cinerariifolium]